MIGEDGTVYIGSADRFFYALHPDGTVKYKVQTGEIIDSSALLDDEGRVYFGSGDGVLRALDAQTGNILWTYKADDPAVNKAFINWFEGNVAITPEGDLVVPNDNFFVYNLDRDAGTVNWRWLMNDQTWSLPAVDRNTGNLYMGNNFIAPLDVIGVFYKNIFAVTKRGKLIWKEGVQATISASPMLLDNKVIMGAFDGFVRAYAKADGKLLWEFGTSDHIYASPALLPDGTIVQPSTNGTIYALNPENGKLVWAFDTKEPIRSSPAVDGKGRIYFGSGDGRLYVLNPDGTRRFSMLLIEEDRNDLNASPALGLESVYIAGENGGIFSIPYDYCLRPEGREDRRCVTDENEDLPESGAVLYFISPFGSMLETPPSTIEANQPLAFSLFVRDENETLLALIDEGSVKIDVNPPGQVEMLVSGDRRFLTIVPSTTFAQDEITLSIKGKYLVNPKREGLLFSGGVVGGSFDETFHFKVDKGTSDYGFSIPEYPGDTSGSFEIYRCAVPVPTVMPSYNQIGFDSLHYLIGMVEGTPDSGLAWLIGGMLTEANETIPDPETKVLMPLELNYKEGLLTLLNQNGFMVNAMNADVFFDTFRVSANLDHEGHATTSPGLHVTTDCSKIPTYGPFLINLGFCNPKTNMLSLFGSFSIRPHNGGAVEKPEGLGTVSFAYDGGGIVLGNASFTVYLKDSTLKRKEHSFGILLVNAKTNKVISHQYGLATQRKANAKGDITSVVLSLPEEKVPQTTRAYLMVDTYPAAVATLEIPRWGLAAALIGEPLACGL